MSAAEYSPKAVDDLKRIFDFIAADRPKAATKIIKRVLDAGDTLAKFPELGRGEMSSLKVFVLSSSEAM